MRAVKYRIDCPRVLMFSVTYRCNAKCKMCNIWDMESGPDLSVSDLDRILSDQFLAYSLQFVNLTGGECFLREDLVDLVKVLVDRCPNLITIELASNGFLTDRILKATGKMIAATLPSNIMLSIGLSFDGVGPVHDEVRGVPGGFERMVETLERLRHLEKIYSPKFAVGVGANINAITIDHLDETYQYFRERRIPASFTPWVSSDLYYQNIHNQENFDLTPEMRKKAYAFYRGLLKDRYIDKHFFKFVKGWLLEGKRSVGCIFRGSGIFLEPNGDLYPCVAYQKFKMGNLLETEFSEIWQKDELGKMYREMADYCLHCGSDCEIKKASLKNRLKRDLYNWLVG